MIEILFVFLLNSIRKIMYEHGVYNTTKNDRICVCVVLLFVGLFLLD